MRYKEGSVAERFKAFARITRKYVLGSSPLLAGHAGENRLLAGIPASWFFFVPCDFLYVMMALKSPLRGAIIRIYSLFNFLFI